MPHFQGIDSELVSLESIIDWEVVSADDSKGGDGPPQLGQEFYSKLSQRLGERLAECGDRVPVVTGESTFCANLLRIGANDELLSRFLRRRARIATRTSRSRLL